MFVEAHSNWDLSQIAIWWFCERCSETDTDALLDVAFKAFLDEWQAWLEEAESKTRRNVRAGLRSNNSEPRVKAPFLPFLDRRVAAWVAAAQTIALTGGEAQLTSVCVKQARGVDGWYVDLQGSNLNFGRGRTLRARAMQVAETIGWEIAESGALPAYAPGSGSDEDLHDYIVDLITQHAAIACAIAEKLTTAATKIDGEELAVHLAAMLRRK